MIPLVCTVEVEINISFIIVQKEKNIYRHAIYFKIISLFV